MMRVCLLAPIKTSLYSRLVAHLVAGDPDLELTGVVVRTPWNYRRIRGEIRRDGPRLLRKVYQKLVLGDAAYERRDERTVRALAQRVGLPGRTLGDLAERHQFKLTVVADHNDAVAEQALKEARPDAIAFTGGGLIRRNILELPRIGVLNCHAGIMPEYRGMDVVEWPVVEMTGGEPALGITLGLMDKGVDTGPILLKRSLTLEPDDTFASLRRRIEPMMVQLMLEGLRGLNGGSCRPSEQRPEQGRQYYVMHPRLVNCAQRRLRRHVATLSRPVPA